MVRNLAKALTRELRAAMRGHSRCWPEANVHDRRAPSTPRSAAGRAGIGVIADGIVGPRCQVLLNIIAPQGDQFGALALNVSHVSQLFPATKPANIARYLPYVEAALAWPA